MHRSQRGQTTPEYLGLLVVVGVLVVSLLRISPGVALATALRSTLCKIVQVEPCTSHSNPRSALGHVPAHARSARATFDPKTEQWHFPPAKSTAGRGWERTPAIRRGLRGLRPPNWSSLSGDEQAWWLQRQYMYLFSIESHKCDSLCQLAFLAAVTAADGFAPSSEPGGGEVAPASSMVSAVGLARQLATEEGSAIFTEDGSLQPSVIEASDPIKRGTELGNTALKESLTSDGSRLADWAKYSTPTFESPSGPFQVHFYYNKVADEVYYLLDYKAVFNDGIQPW